MKNIKTKLNAPLLFNKMRGRRSVCISNTGDETAQVHYSGEGKRTWKSVIANLQTFEWTV